MNFPCCCCLYSCLKTAASCHPKSLILGRVYLSLEKSVDSDEEGGINKIASGLPRLLSGYGLLLFCRFKFAEEAGIVLREETKVADAIFQVGDALHTHAEGIAGIDIAVNAACIEVVRIYHTAS